MSAFSINNPHRRELRRKSKPSRFYWCVLDRENLGALTVPHHGQITEGLATTSWFTRRDQFTVSQVNSLNRFLKVIGTGIGDLVPLGRFLFSKETLIVLITPSLFSAYGVIKELSQTGRVCLVITSRIIRTASVWTSPRRMQDLSSHPRLQQRTRSRLLV